MIMKRGQILQKYSKCLAWNRRKFMFNFWKFNEKPIMPSHPLNGLWNAKVDTNFDDKQVSSFAYYRGDTHKLILSKEVVDSMAIDRLLEQGFIGELENRILGIINDMIYLTVPQLYQVLKYNKLSVGNEELQCILRKLENKIFLKRLELTNDIAYQRQKRFDVYSLGQHGAGLLKAKGEKVQLQDYTSVIPTAEIKRILAKNHLMLAVMSKTQVSFEMQVHLFNRFINEDEVVYPQAIMKCNGQTYLVECVRRAEGWTKNFMDQVELYDNLLKHYEALNIYFSQKPNIIFLAENYKHMLLLKEMCDDCTNIPKVFTCDLALEDNVDNAFYNNVLQKV